MNSDNQSHNQEDKLDHRKIGRDLDLFVFSDLVGAGLPLWTPRGTILRRELDDFVQEMRDEAGFLEVTTPHITKKELYEKSGHWTKFKDDLFHVNSREGHEFAMKPMNCPHHTQIYASKPRSYRDLPIRYRETTMDYRDEQTGELHGLLRGRSFTQDDAHVFCREGQLQEEVTKIYAIVKKFYETFNLPVELYFSKRDPAKPEAYAGTAEQWQEAEAALKRFIDSDSSIKVANEVEGEAAFYGPKLDFMAKDSLGRERQVATIQIDFAQPEGLGLAYVNEEGQEERPVMIHCAIMGSIERFLAVLLEHTEGKLPLWLSPEQLRVITLNDEKNILEMAESVVNDAKSKGIRVSLDPSNESVGKKIANAESLKIPYMVVIGAKEAESREVLARTRADLEDVPSWKPEELLDKITSDIASRI